MSAALAVAGCLGVVVVAAGVARSPCPRSPLRPEFGGRSEIPVGSSPRRETPRPSSRWIRFEPDSGPGSGPGSRSAPVRRRFTGPLIVVLGCLAIVHPWLAAAVAVIVWAATIVARRRNAIRSIDNIGDGMTDAIDLFAVALLSGSTVAASTTQVGQWVGGELGAAFRRCSRKVEQGRPMVDALEELADELGPQSRPLVGALVASDRYGASIINNLRQLGADSRDDRRRRAETAARRLPVVLLFPLVGCVLPAFLLITVVPVIVDTVSAFDLLASP